MPTCVCLQSRSLAPPTDVQHCPSEKEEVAKESKEQQKGEQREEKKEEQREASPAFAVPPMNLLATVFRLRRDLHRAEEQKARVRNRRRCRMKQHLLLGVESESRRSRRAVTPD